MINLNIKDFLRILFSFIGIAYLLTFIYSIIIGFQLETAYEIGGEVGYNMGFVSYYVVLIAIAFTAFFSINVMVSKFRLSNK
ncbi:hypothetical protein QYS49_29340 [Marivirga salinae]|uniref:Uncharacterized protein n=1 Tax=Marivirga salinarum TaxID=3059078 RepID=A0AA49GEA2_9BACT|nr:hypothetical protein [Marivirga sp. BDSF4-3]WKK75558.1 hypothetical protein QYS49_29340 [Marivirga sp. BDSF4-3]